MSILIVQIPQRLRFSARGRGSADQTTSRQGLEYDYVTSPDGLVLESQGRCVASRLPKSTVVVAVLADTDVSWHRITLPKSPAARLRAALDGVLEEALLDEPEAVHLALAPHATPGQPTWVAAVDRRWIRGELDALGKADVFVDRIVPMAWPDDPPIGHFAETHDDPGGPAQTVALNWAHPDGVLSIRLQGGLARALVPAPPPPATRWSASPAAAAAAEQWLGAPVTVMTPGQRSLQAARSLWNLRQFDMVRSNRGTRAFRDSARHFFSPAWRTARYGLAALALANLVGLNVWAWHQRDAIAAKQATIQNLVKVAYPGVRENDIQRDAAAVMQRESQALRALAGKPGDTDLEPMLQAAASAWPTDRPPVESLRYEPGKLTLSAAGWSATQIEQFRNLLLPTGWQVEATEGRLTLSRSRKS